MTLDSPRGQLLENDPQNPCVGCGPTNPRGLQLAFRRDGKRVVTEFVAHETLEGWPGRLHSGLLYLAMLDRPTGPCTGSAAGSGSRCGRVPSRSSAGSPPARGSGWWVSRILRARTS